ncbi:phytase [Luteolibacter luteus]|nr:phytase [Luteolibacter luteus]
MIHCGVGDIGRRLLLALMLVPGLPPLHGEEAAASGTAVIRPKVITEPVPHDSDDPAIWINPADPLKSLVLGTDKNTDGGLFAFGLDGKIVKRVGGLKRPNNVDVLSGFQLGGKQVDIAVLTEREMQRLRVFLLPDLTPLDRGDLVVFDGDAERAPMGIALYQRPRDHASFAIVGGKSGPKDGYLWQYRLKDDGQGQVKMSLARKFGSFTGEKEIESIAVDSAAGSVFYSDETYGVREYAADPDAPDAAVERSVTGRDGFTKDREGISIYPTGNRSGYLLVSDQAANSFRIFRREIGDGSHAFLKSVQVVATDSDGSDVTAVPLGPDFPKGLFVAMSADRTYHFYSWEDIAGAGLSLSPDNGP